MRLLRFLGRWYLIASIIPWVVFGPDPRVTAGVLLGVLVAGNRWHRYRVAEVQRRQSYPAPVMYPVPWPVPWYPPYGPAPYNPPAPPAPVDSVRTPDSAPDEPSAHRALPPGEPEDGDGGNPVTRLVAVVLVGLVALAGITFARPTPAQAATQIAARDVPAAPAVEPAISLPNPYTWLFEQMIGAPLRGETEAALRSSLDVSQASFLTPQLDTQSRVVQLWDLLLVVADALLGVLLVVGTLMLIAGDAGYLEAKALAPRMVIAGVGVNLSLRILGQCIVWSNQLVKGFLSFGSTALGPALSDTLSKVRTPLVLGLLLVVVMALVFANILRLIVVLVLAVGAPVMLAFGVLPASDGVARAWWRAMAACLISPAVQALLLVLAVWITSTGATPFELLFANPVWTSIVDGSMLVAIIALMAISPLWMLKRALGSGHHHMAAAFRWGRRAVGGLS
jgi:hypothetical protein